MIQDLAELDPPLKLACDLCVLGSGPAGLALARRFNGSGLAVVVLEAGGMDWSEVAEDMNEGRVAGPFADTYSLISTRRRQFGGATNHWGGWCAPLDPWDFEARSWVPHSGWPIRLKDIETHYRTAAAFLEVEREVGPDRVDPPLERRLDETLRTVLWRFSALRPAWVAVPKTLRDRMVAELQPSSNVTVLLRAVATDLESTEDAGRVTGVRVRGPGTKEMRIEARAVVLACGGIDNARLLLNADRVQAGGLGNAHDLVGRFFMEHPHTPAARFLSDTDAYGALRDRRYLGRDFLPGISLGLEAQRRAGVTNGSITLESAPTGESGAEVLASWTLFARMEQVPNPDSRVYLSDDRDAMGLRRVVLDWRLTEHDRRSVRTLVAAFARHAGMRGLGRVQFDETLSETSWPDGVFGGAHHMGTTRMADDPRHGVVDRDCRVHGIENLYVAGSSVFPTGGWANPTLTLTALAFRLGDHLAATLKA